MNVVGAAAASSRASPAKLIDNQDYFPELMRLLGTAKKSVDIVQYNFFSESGHGADVANELIQLKKDHPAMKIRLFIEADHGDGASRNATTIAKLKAAGIEVTPDSQNLVTHAKAVCVDSKYVLAGSHNLSNTSMDKNNEVSVSIASPTLAKGYEAYFASLLSQPGALHPSSLASGGVTMLTDTAYEAQLLALINGAHGTLDASMYDLNFNGHDLKAQEIMTALAAAASRGVKVNLFLEQGTGAFAPAITEANKKAASWLAQRGVTVKLDAPAQISHQKFIIRDGQEVLLGSSNWTADDLDRRHQLNWRIADPAFAHQLGKILQTEMSTEGVPVTR